ncbi:MAG: hypothetical protein HYY96_10920 [Candidatus Tectomicrobia bacterium]|nr:hypothetical protein [Candidatus Tectomicrobia bacterium]
MDQFPKGEARDAQGDTPQEGVERRDLFKHLGIGAAAFLLAYHRPSIRSFKVVPEAYAQMGMGMMGGGMGGSFGGSS